LDRRFHNERWAAFKKDTRRTDKAEAYEDDSQETDPRKGVDIRLVYAIPSTCEAYSSPREGRGLAPWQVVGDSPATPLPGLEERVPSQP